MKEKKIAVIGLGYVGLPLAVEFGKRRSIIGLDINPSRINELKNGIDSTLETTDQELQDTIHLSYTTNLDNVKDCEIFIITVPTPIDKHKRPDLTPLESSSEMVETTTEIYHYSNEGGISWCNFAKEIFELKKIDCKVAPVTTSQYPTLAQRPKNTTMNKNKIVQMFNIKTVFWRDSLEKCLGV